MADMDIDVEIGLIVSGWRRNASLSQDALAQAIGTQQTAISKIESGKQCLTVGQLLAVLSACGVSVSVAVDELSRLRRDNSKPLWERIDE